MIRRSTTKRSTKLAKKRGEFIEAHSVQRDPRAIELEQRLVTGTTIKVLGIDPSTSVFGYALLECMVTDRRDGLRIMEFGTFGAQPKTPRYARLQHDFRVMRKMHEELQPDLVIVERGFMAKSVSATEALGEARGVTLAAFHDRLVLGIPPMSARKAVLGRGDSTKDEARRDLRALYPAVVSADRTNKGKPDAYDALVVALSWRHALTHH